MLPYTGIWQNWILLRVSDWCSAACFRMALAGRSASSLHRTGACKGIQRMLPPRIEAVPVMTEDGAGPALAKKLKSHEV